MSSVIIKSIVRNKIQTAVSAYAADLRHKHPEVERIIWFGSWVTGSPTPGSDVDLCLILSESDQPRRERISKYLPLGFPVGVDLFAYTQDEFEQLKQHSPSWYQAIASGVEI